MAGRIRWRNLVDSPSPTALERLQLGALSGASCLYRAGLALDRCLHRLRGPWRPPVPSVCVGNITVGGTGKTTLVRHLARRLEDRGIRAAVILRGYGRLDPRSTRVVHDGRSLLEGPDTAGDEAVMLAQGLSRTVVVVGPSRRASSELALTRLGVQALLFDDGLQHWGLSAHRTVALWDATVDPSRARLLPRGCLREPLGGLRRFNVLIITRCDAAPDCARVAKALGRIRGGAAAPLANHAPVAVRDAQGTRHRPESLAGQRLLAFSSLGNPGAFSATLTALGAEVLEDRVFPDHHRYTAEEVKALGAAAEALGADGMVTTEKDWAKLAAMETPAVRVLEVDFALARSDLGGASPLDDLVDFLGGEETAAGE